MHFTKILVLKITLSLDFSLNNEQKCWFVDVLKNTDKFSVLHSYTSVVIWVET